MILFFENICKYFFASICKYFFESICKYFFSSISLLFLFHNLGRHRAPVAPRLTLGVRGCCSQPLVLSAVSCAVLCCAACCVLCCVVVNPWCSELLSGSFHAINFPNALSNEIFSKRTFISVLCLFYQGNRKITSE